MGRARALLSERCGVPVLEALAQIELRLPTADVPATITGYANSIPISNDEEETFREEKR